MKISVIIPNYNRADLIGETIENLLKQSRPPEELIVVDDGSTDDSVEKIRSYGDRVTLIQQENSGPGAARNRGFEASTGELIQFMDSDDLASLNKLKVQSDALMKSNADFAYCPWVRTEINGESMKFIGSLLQSQAVPDWKPMFEWALGRWCLVFQNCLFRRECLEAAGKYRTDLMPTEDSEYLIRILHRGAKPIFTGDCVVFYRDHEQGQITSTGTTSLARTEDMTRYYETIGEVIRDRVDSMHPSTRNELTRLVSNHNRYCQSIGVSGTKGNSTIQSLVNRRSALAIRFETFLDRVTRKLRGVVGPAPNQPALKFGDPNCTWVQLLCKKAGYRAS